MLGMTNRFQMCVFLGFFVFLENLGCPLGNQTPNSGCPEPFSGCPGSPDTRYVGPCRNVSKSMNTA